MEDQEQLERVAVGSGWGVGASISLENLEIHILKLIHNRSLGDFRKSMKIVLEPYTRDSGVKCRLLRQVCFRNGFLRRPIIYSTEKLTCNLKMDPWKRRFLFGILPLFRFRVSFRGSISTGLLYCEDECDETSVPEQPSQT